MSKLNDRFQGTEDLLKATLKPSYFYTVIFLFIYTRGIGLAPYGTCVGLWVPTCIYLNQQCTYYLRYKDIIFLYV